MTHDAIFRKAMGSTNPNAISMVARELLRRGDYRRGFALNRRVLQLQQIGFGAMARGTPIKDTNGAVIPPGRYWLDVLGNKRTAFTEWKKGKPEVKVEVTEDHPDEERIFVIFTIPQTASNYGMPGVFFPTNVLGFPTIADSGITSSTQTIQRPDAPTSTDVVASIAQSGAIVTKSFLETLGLTPTKIVILVMTTLVGGIVLKRIIPKIIP